MYSDTFSVGALVKLYPGALSFRHLWQKHECP